MNARAQRRGSIAALVVGVLIIMLYVALQPAGQRPTAVVASSETTTTLPTTTRLPKEHLCELARRFVDDASSDDMDTNARLAESFFAEARTLASSDLRAEYEAAAAYYAEYNALGEPYDYDPFRITAAGNGDRWVQLKLRPPLGVQEATADVAAQCGVELPPPPTITTTTTTTTRPPTTTAAPATSAAPVPTSTATTSPHASTTTSGPGRGR